MSRETRPLPRPRATATLLGVLLTLQVALAAADWSGDIEGGTVIRDNGNATRLRLSLANNERPFSQNVYVEWLRDVDGENSYVAAYEPRYWLTQTLYTFGEARYRVDKPLQIDSEVLLLLGLGARLLDTANHALFAEVGTGSRSTEFADGGDTREAIVIARAGFFQILAEQLRFEISGNALQGAQLAEAQAETGIALRVPGGAIRYSYRARWIKLDGEDTVSDSDTFLSFTYGF